MVDYTLQYPGVTIDALLGKVNNPDSSPTANSDNLVTSGGVKAFVEAITGLLENLNTTAKTNLVAAINEAAQTGAGGLVDITTQEDGALVFVFSDESTITVDLNHNHPQYYAKAVETSNPSGGFLPDVVYSLGTLTGTVTFTLAAAVTGNVNHYFWMFDTSSTAPTITWPTGITWASGSAPTVAASKHYEISVLNGIAYYSEV